MTTHYQSTLVYLYNFGQVVIIVRPVLPVKIIPESGHLHTHTQQITQHHQHYIVTTC